MVQEPSLDEQIKEAQRELALRKSVFPKWVATGRLKQNDADHRIAAQAAILGTLLTVRRVCEVLEEEAAKNADAR